jgi:thiol:disulfide interchange protein DsbD
MAPFFLNAKSRKVKCTRRRTYNCVFMLRSPIRTVTVLAASLVCLLSVAAASSPEKVQAKHAQVEFLSRQAAVRPGQELLVGVRFSLEPGWHIYWVNPGDSGQPPAFKWQLPEGFTAGEILWPRPERMQSTPQLADYGYHGDVLLAVPMRVSPSARTGAAAITLEAKWLICREICLPDRAQLQVSLPVGPESRDNPATAALFAANAKLLPQPLPANWKARAQATKESLVLALETGRTPSQAAFFPLDPDQIDNAALQKLEPTPRGAKITLRKSDLLVKPIRTLRGVLVLPGGNAYHVEAPVGAGKD